MAFRLTATGGTLTPPVTINGSASATVRPLFVDQPIPNGTGLITGDATFPIFARQIITETDLTRPVYAGGIGSFIWPGFGGIPSTTTAQPFTSSITVQGCGNQLTEYAPYYGHVESQIGTGFTQSAGPSGRYWMTDYQMIGSLAVQPYSFSGISMLMNNLYNGSPSGTQSEGITVLTKQGVGANSALLNAAQTYPIDVGIQVTGRTGTTPTSTNVGFTTGLKLGGAGSQWATPGSRFVNAAEILDYDTYGIKISGKFSGSTPTAALAIADGIGPVIFGGLTTPFTTGTLQVLHTGQIDPLVRFGTNAVSNAFSIAFGNSSGLGKLIVDAGGIFITGSAAGDTGIISSTSGKAFHIAGGTTKVITVTQAATLGFYATTPAAQPANTVDTRAALITLGLTASGGFGPLARVTSDVSTTSASAVNVTGLSFAIAANEIWQVEFWLTVTGPAGGTKFDINGPASPTNLRISILGDTTAVTAISTETLTAFATLSAAYCTSITGLVRIACCINNGANAGTIQLRFASTTGGNTSTVLANSYMSARRIG